MFKFKCAIWFWIIWNVTTSVELRSVQFSEDVKCQSRTLPAPFVNSNGHCECIRGYKWNGAECVLDTENTTPEKVQIKTKPTTRVITETLTSKATTTQATTLKAPTTQTTTPGKIQIETKPTTRVISETITPEAITTQATTTQSPTTQATTTQATTPETKTIQTTTTQKPSCTCMAGYIKIAETCVPFDTCNEKHTGNIACPSEYTKCVPTGQIHDFKCICEDGFFNEHGIQSSDTKCLPKDPCVNCERNCFQVGTDYKCLPERCSNGFKLELGQCILDVNSDYFKTKFSCLDKVIEINSQDSQPCCKCGDQKFDPKTRGCSSTHCSSEMLDKCKTKGASSCRWSKDYGKPQCHCTEGNIPYTENPANFNDWKCIPQCDLWQLLEQPEFRCSESFEHCNTKTQFEKFAHELKSADWSNSIFVKGQTKLNATDEKHYCKCDTGFERHLTKCEPSERPTHYIKGLEFEWNPMGEDDDEYIKHVEKAFEQLIKSILKLTEANKVSDVECLRGGQKTISCSVSFESDLPDSEIRDRLDKGCVKVSEDKCVYNLPNNLCPTKHSNV